MTAPEHRRGNSTRSRILVWVLVLIPYFGVGVLTVRVAGEQHRTREQLQIDCPFFADIGSAPLPTNASELARRIVRDSAESYHARGCERLAGPLQSPTPTPTPTPSRR